MDGVLCGADTGVVGHGEGCVDGDAGRVTAGPLNADSIHGKDAESVGQLRQGQNFYRLGRTEIGT